MQNAISQKMCWLMKFPLFLHHELRPWDATVTISSRYPEKKSTYLDNILRLVFFRLIIRHPLWLHISVLLLTSVLMNADAMCGARNHQYWKLTTHKLIANTRVNAASMIFARWYVPWIDIFRRKRRRLRKIQVKVAKALHGLPYPTPLRKCNAQKDVLGLY